MLNQHIVLSYIPIQYEVGVYLARLSLMIIFGTVLILLDALIFLLNKVKHLLTELLKEAHL